MRNVSQKTKGFWIGVAMAVPIAANPSLAAPQDVKYRALAVPDNPGDANAVRCKNADVNNTDNRSGTAMVGLTACWDANPSNASYRILNDLYAHWTLQRIDNNQFPREYNREDIPAPLRLFFGRDRSFVSSIRIDMHDPDLPVVIPLVNFGYEGKVGKGQNWTSDVVNDDQSQPYFRIGPSTSATISVSAKSTDDVEVRATTAILSALRSITSIVSPGGSLVTTLNREPLASASNTVDTALSTIWSQVRDEHQISGRQLSEWYEGAGILIDVEIPKFVKTRANGSGTIAANPDGFTRRVYALRLSCPRYSIFDPALACAKPPSGQTSDPGNEPTQADQKPGYQSDAFATSVIPLRERISPQQILNYPLAQGKTLAQFLSDHAWYTQFLRMVDKSDLPTNTATNPPPPAPPPALAPALAPAQPLGMAAAAQTTGTSTPIVRTRSDNDYASLCAQIVDSLYGAGLSSFDARLGLWATVTESSDFVGTAQNFQKVEECRNLLPLKRYSTWVFADLAPAKNTTTNSKSKKKNRPIR